MCGYTLDDDDDIVEGFYAVCIYETDKRRYKSQCMSKEDLEGKTDGDFVNKDDALLSCGCCDESIEHKDTPTYCYGLDDERTDPLSHSDLEQHHCDEDKHGKVEVEFCYYDTSKTKEKTKCNDPFGMGIKDEDIFLNWRAALR
jgi:hypothetical protein